MALGTVPSPYTGIAARTAVSFVGEEIDADAAAAIQAGGAGIPALPTVRFIALGLDTMARAAGQTRRAVSAALPAVRFIGQEVDAAGPTWGLAQSACGRNRRTDTGTDDAAAVAACLTVGAGITAPPAVALICLEIDTGGPAPGLRCHET